MLNRKILEFDILKKEDQKEYRKLERLRSKFVKSFPIKSIMNLEFDEYIVGKSSKKSFCYRIETELKSLGNLKGSTSTKFGVYFGRKGKDTIKKYRFSKKYGTELDAAFEDVKKSIQKLLESGENDNYESIEKNKVAPIFKYKLLGTYFPEKYLNIYSRDHLDYFISKLGINNTSKSIPQKQQNLLNFKHSNSISKDWTNIEFARFLYTKIGRPPKEDKDKKLLSLLPPLESVKLTTIKVLAEDRSDSPQSKSTSGKIDHQKKNRLNTILGLRAENLVFNNEVQKVKAFGYSKELVNHISLSNDRAGYDIQTLDEYGKRKLIEVKGTRSKLGQIQINITDNELSKSKELDNYFIYVVFEAHTKNPKLWEMPKEFKHYLDEFTLNPVVYKLNLNTYLTNS